MITDEKVFQKPFWIHISFIPVVNITHETWFNLVISDKNCLISNDLDYFRSKYFANWLLEIIFLHAFIFGKQLTCLHVILGPIIGMEIDASLLPHYGMHWLDWHYFFLHETWYIPTISNKNVILDAKKFYFWPWMLLLYILQYNSWLSGRKLNERLPTTQVYWKNIFFWNSWRLLKLS